MGKIIWNIFTYQPRTDTLTGITLEDTIALDWGKNFGTVVYANQSLIHLLRLGCFPKYTTGNFPMCRESSLLPRDFLSITVHYSIFSQHNCGFITHTQTRTHITGGSTFISELLSFKPKVLLSQ